MSGIKSWYFCNIFTYRKEIFNNVQTTPAWNDYIYLNFRYFLLSSIYCLSRILKINPTLTDNRISHIVINCKNMQKCDKKLAKQKLQCLFCILTPTLSSTTQNMTLLWTVSIIIFIICCTHTHQFVHQFVHNIAFYITHHVLNVTTEKGLISYATFRTSENN